jgi:predicted aldo/keto reductase-like oxidoreductase
MSDAKQDKLDRRDFIKRAAAGAVVGAAGAQLGAAAVDTSAIRSYNPAMEYRPLGKTGLMVSAVCMGGHWKRVNRMAPGCFEGENWLGVDLSHEGFNQNRYEVVSRCIEHGINYIDACTRQEVLAYGAALKGRRDSVYLGFSWYQEELRNAKYRTAEALVGTLEKGMKEAGLDYVDVWRITMHEQSSRHTEGEVAEMMKALQAAREQGKARLTGFSSHDRPHIKWMIETYPEVVQVVCTPFTAKTKERPTDSLFETARQHGVGIFGIKPFANNSVFKGDATPQNPHAKEDDEIARLTIRHILATDCITAPIPGLINTHQVDNVARAVQERRELDVAEKAKLEKATDEAFAKLPPDYEWLRDWEWV